VDPDSAARARSIREQRNLHPYHPCRPALPLPTQLLLGLLSSLFLGVLLVFGLEYLDNRLRKGEDVERLLGAPVIGEIPKSDL
jgi:capsular polysaccharide biosynthesis protein